MAQMWATQVQPVQQQAQDAKPGWMQACRQACKAKQVLGAHRGTAEEENGSQSDGQQQQPGSMRQWQTDSAAGRATAGHSGVRTELRKVTPVVHRRVAYSTSARRCTPRASRR
ncbi:hypothetical protein OsI_05143 [Oryza sativa Indica Group]|uniref:Uncharacterized protein n=1 Tax=Oryza sativa subsp. indica TaxID=39946 RepID=A2WYX7_ORYSI|nr:hypothetical protein OsI_05143 [Oryza sativa Indica Group]